MQDWEEGIVKLGFFLPHVGQAAGPDAIAQAVERAEELGYDSLWVTDRILYPVKGQSPYPGTPDGTLPEAFHGKFFDVPSSYIEPKPFQKPHPPIYLAAYAPGSMQRVATMADGWMPAGIPLEPMGQMME